MRGLRWTHYFTYPGLAHLLTPSPALQFCYLSFGLFLAGDSHSRNSLMTQFFRLLYAHVRSTMTILT